ncbi:hypothetical protein AGMMS49990_09480 [Endomicrobiia bacterium]|nr:hypothetical protein AGMMS49990_09480 [Endomicrobiia bacterium]
MEPIPAPVSESESGLVSDEPESDSSSRPTLESIPKPSPSLTNKAEDSKGLSDEKAAEKVERARLDEHKKLLT